MPGAGPADSAGAGRRGGPDVGGPDALGPAPARRRAAMAGHAGDGSTARALLADERDGVRSSALAALARAGALTPSDLRRAFGDRSAVVRRRACDLAGRYRRRAHVGDLRRALGDPVADVAEAAAFALGEMGGGSRLTCAALAAVAGEHPDAMCREAAVAALGALGRPEGLGAVLRATRDKAAVRRRAVIALAAFEGTEVAAALTLALADPDWQVRQAAEDLVGGQESSRS
jgi:HEAT repeat protein